MFYLKKRKNIFVNNDKILKNVIMKIINNENSLYRLIILRNIIDKFTRN